MTNESLDKSNEQSEKVVFDNGEVVVKTSRDASQASVRILEMSSTSYDRLIEEAKEKAAKIVADAEEEAKNRIGSLESQKSELEKDINDLRHFENDLREEMQTFLEGELRHFSKTVSDEQEESSE